MKKTIGCLLVAVSISSVILFGCGKEKETAEPVSSAPEETFHDEVSDAPVAGIDSTDGDKQTEAFTEETVAAATEEPVVAAAAPESEDSGETIATVNDKTIYNDNGVVISFDSFKYSNDADAVLILSVENNNPDNKKLTFSDSYYNLNGLCNMRCNGDIHLVDAGGNVEFISGDSGRIAIPIYLDGYKSTMEILDCSDMGVETIGLCLGLVIGSDSEPVYISKELQTEKYNKQDINKLYGDQVAHCDLQPDSIPVDIYCKENSSGGLTVVVKNVADNYNRFGRDYLTLCANGHDLSIGSIFSDEMVAPTGAVVLRCDDSEDSIRKNNEIGNDETLEIMLRYFGEDSVVVKQY